MKIYPAIDLLDGQVVRLREGKRDQVTVYDRDPVALAAGYGSHNALSKAFKQHFGLSPQAFRELGCAAATRLLVASQNRYK